MSSNPLKYDAKTVKQYVTALQVAQDFGHVKMASCNQSNAAWRNGDNPTAIFYNEDGTYHDYVLDSHGDAIQLYKLITGVSFVEAVNALGDQYCPNEKLSDNMKEQKRPARPITPATTQETRFQPPPAMSQLQPSPTSNATNMQTEIKINPDGTWAPVNLPRKKSHYEELIAEGYTETRRYDYKTETGVVSYQTVRLDPPLDRNDLKKQVLPYDIETKSWTLKDKKRLLYNLPEIIKEANQTIVITEGEKCAESCIKHGFCATTSGGSNTWRTRFANWLRSNSGKDIVMLRDDDLPGEKYAMEIAIDVIPIARSFKILCPYHKKDGKPGGDIADFFEDGRTVEELNKMIEETRSLTQEDIPELQERLEKNQKGASAVNSKKNGELGGRPATGWEPQTIAEMVVKRLTDNSGKRLLYLLDKRWINYDGNSHQWQELDTADLKSVITTQIQRENRFIIQTNEMRVESEKKKADEEGKTNSFNPAKVHKDPLIPSHANTINSVIVNLLSFDLCRIDGIKMPCWLDRDRQDENEKPNGIGWLNVKNGIIDVDTIGKALANNMAIPEGTIRPHTPDFLTLTSQLPIGFNPQATCPRFEEHIKDVLPDLEARRHLQMMFGFMLMFGDYRYNVAFAFLGQSGSGKSTTANVLKALLGTKNVSTVPFSSFGEKFSLAGLVNSALNVDEDMAAIEEATASSTAESRFKILTDGGELDFERKGEQPFKAASNAHLLFCCNALPYIKDKSKAIHDRLRIIHFNERFRGTKKQNQQQAKDLTSTKELEGVLIWALKGWGMLQQQYPQNFPELEASKKEKQIWELRCTPEMEFINDYLEIGSGADFLSTREIYADYKEWAENHGHRLIGENRFVSSIISKFPHAETGRGKDKIGNRSMGVFGIKQKLPKTANAPQIADETDIPNYNWT